jgi:hypothetical protein
MLNRVRRAAGLDFHVLTTLVLRTWQILAGVVMVLLVPYWLSKVEQGYYFTFSSLIALNIFFELGLGFVVTQLAGHEVGHLRRSEGGTLVGEARHLDRLASLVHLLRRWYRIAAVLFFVGVGAAGLVFFARSGDLPLRAWTGPWLLLVLAGAATFYLSPLLSITEGLGDVGQVARMRGIGSLVGYLLMWAVLALGGALWSLPILPAMGVAVTVYWLRRHNQALAGLEQRVVAPGAERISWRAEIFPLQWRIGTSWASGYFIFYLFTPTIFAYQGAVEAGRLGLAFALFNSIQTLGMSWVNAKAPAFASLIGSNDRVALNRTFWGATARSFAFVAVASLGVLAAAWLLERIGAPIAGRVSGLPVLACLAVVTVANSLVFAFATYMRAHKEEPMLVPSIVGGALTAAIVLLAAPRGVFLTIFLYALVTLFIGLPWAALLFRRYHR